MLLFLLFALVSETIASTVGFGASTILLPFAVYYFDFKSALTLVGFFHLFGSLGRLGFFRHGLNRGVLIKFGLPSIVFSLIGAYFVQTLTQETFKGILGFFLIGYGTISLVNNAFQVKPSPTNLVAGGVISGFFAGLIGTGGALRATFLSAFKKDKAIYLATTAALSLAVDLTRIPFYLANDFLDPSLYVFVPILLGIALVATFLGKLIANRLPVSTFEKLIHLAIILTGIKFVIDWLTH